MPDVAFGGSLVSFSTSVRWVVATTSRTASTREDLRHVLMWIEADVAVSLPDRLAGLVRVR